MTLVSKAEPKIHLLESAASHEMHSPGGLPSASSIEGWLKDHHVIPFKSLLLNYSDEEPWFRSGSETYLARASAQYLLGPDHENTITVTFVLKALVGLFSSAQADKWRTRRTLLQQIRVPVSNWFDLFDATIVEPFYPYGRDSFNNPLYLPNLVRIAALLDGHGFRTLNFLSDLRSDGRQLYYIDFGFDLGEPDSTTSDNAKRTLQDFCHKNHLMFPERLYLDAMQKLFTKNPENHIGEK